MPNESELDVKHQKMKKEFKKHVQKYCDISNWSRMHKPRKGKENYEAGVALCEDILRLMLKHEPGENGTAIILTALALVNSYVRKGIGFTPAFDMDSDIDLINKYMDLFKGDWWMGMHEDFIHFQIEDFIRGERDSMYNELKIEDNKFNELH